MRTAAFGDIKERHTYVNYAVGSETPEELYGYVTTLRSRTQLTRTRHEEWRISKLRALKEKYDPENRFGYFGGIIRDEEANDL